MGLVLPKWKPPSAPNDSLHVEAHERVLKDIKQQHFKKLESKTKSIQ